MHAKPLWISSLAATLAIALLPSKSLAGADSWPQRTVRVIVPFAAGSDPAARAFAEQLAKRWKQPVVIGTARAPKE
jgi:tripartite-type tricarboxylate transporter receptor subunit TctC